jgi:hypothetical protein
MGTKEAPIEDCSPPHSPPSEIPLDTQIKAKLLGLLDTVEKEVKYKREKRLINCGCLEDELVKPLAKRIAALEKQVKNLQDAGAQAQIDRKFKE